MTTLLSKLLEEATETLNKAIGADNGGEYASAYENYKKAFERLNHYRVEFDKKYLPYYKRAEEIAREPNTGSSITDTAQLWRSSAYSSPKLSHFVKLSNVELDAVGGLEDCKRVLIEAAIWPKNYPHFFTGKFLLHH